MTQQWCDEVLFEGVGCDLIAWAGGALFDPRAHGLDPVSNCTALNRGWLAFYRVDARLWLDGLMLDHAVSAPSAKTLRFGPGPAINGVAPHHDPEWGFSSRYSQLALPVDFGGGLLIGAGDACERPGRGVPPAWNYLRLLELVFTGGCLVEAVDHSAIAAALRERHRLHGDAGRVMAYPAAEDWRKAFSYDYGFCD